MPGSIKLTFTKLTGKYDKLVIEGFGRTLPIDCPKQRIIPHDLIHYAIEKVLGLRGFVRLISEGRPEAELRHADYEAFLGECLVETTQAELWSGGEPDDAAFLDMLSITMGTRGQELRPLPPEALDKLRSEIDALTAAWDKVAPYQSLVLELPA